MQVWPLLSHLPVARRAAACSMGKSAATIAGDLPPSSSVSGVRLGAAAAITLRPTAVEPVNTRWSNGSAERSEEHTSELQSLMRHSYAVFSLQKKTIT